MRSGEMFGNLCPDGRDFGVVSLTSDEMAHPSRQGHSLGFCLLPARTIDPQALLVAHGLSKEVCNLPGRAGVAEGEGTG